MRLIDADALSMSMYHEAMEKDSDMQRWDSGCWIRYKLFERVLDAQPTAVDQTMKHGKWIDIDEQAYTWKVRCSCCGNERSMMSTQGKYPNYCEACGARMDVE